MERRNRPAILPDATTARDAFARRSDACGTLSFTSSTAHHRSTASRGRGSPPAWNTSAWPRLPSDHVACGSTSPRQATHRQRPRHATRSDAASRRLLGGSRCFERRPFRENFRCPSRRFGGAAPARWKPFQSMALREPARHVDPWACDVRPSNDRKLLVGRETERDRPSALKERTVAASRLELRNRERTARRERPLELNDLARQAVAHDDDRSHCAHGVARLGNRRSNRSALTPRSGVPTLRMGNRADWGTSVSFPDGRGAMPKRCARSAERTEGA